LSHYNPITPGPLRLERDLAVAAAAFLLLLAFHEPLEAYWFLVPFISPAVLVVTSRPRFFRAGLIPAAALTLIAFVTAFAPRSDYIASLAASHLSDGGPFEMFTYPPLARDVKRIADANYAALLTV